jgi:hypothetical protein
VLARAKAMLAILEGEDGTGGQQRRQGPLAIQRTSALAQLSLFGKASSSVESDSAAPGPMEERSRQVRETLRSLDVNRLTPLEALQLLAKLQSML